MSTPTQPAAVRRRKSSRHDKTGCLTCRHRRKKCVENWFPTCGACIRLNILCVREPIRNLVPAPEAEQARLASGPLLTAWPPRLAAQPSVAYLSAPAPPGDGRFGSRQRRHVMNHYITVLTGHLSVSEQFNSFVSAYLPMAMESAALSDALMALSSGHLALVDESHKVMALEARAAAIRNLSVAIKTTPDRMAWHETNAAACLAFVISDVVMGHKGWYSHLVGTKHVIMSAVTTSGSGKYLYGPDALKTTSEGQWVLRNFAYHDVIASVTLRKKPMLDAAYLEGITNVVDSALGVATELLGIITRISCLDEDTKINQQMAAEEISTRESTFRSACESFEHQLQNWRCHPDSSPGLAAAAYAYRSAVLIYLYRLFRCRLRADNLDNPGDTTSNASMLSALQEKMRAQVVDTLEHVSEIPPGTAPESALLFPLFLAGGEATEDSHIGAVRTRLQLTLDRRRFKNVSRALEVLDDLWELRQGGADADWAQILDASGEELSLT